VIELHGGGDCPSCLPIAVDAVTAGAALAAMSEHLVAGIPAGWVQRMPGAVGGLTGVAVPTLNGVWAYGEEAERDAVLGVLERVSGAGVPHCVQLSPQCSGELPALPQARGMRRDADIPLMVLAGIRAEYPPPDYGDLVIEVLDPKQAPVHAEVAADRVGAPVEAFLQLMTPAVMGRPGVRPYVGGIDGEPVATGVGVCLESHVGIFSVATLPAHRRRGDGAAVTVRAVRDGLDRGAQWAWLQSSPDGYRIYEELGLRTLESWECWIAT
jgi:N-acetylglutamate synthase